MTKLLPRQIFFATNIFFPFKDFARVVVFCRDKCVAVFCREKIMFDATIFVMTKVLSNMCLSR